MSKTFETMCLVLLGAILLVQILSLVISIQLNPMRSQAAVWSGETFNAASSGGFGQGGNSGNVTGNYCNMDPNGDYYGDGC